MTSGAAPGQSWLARLTKVRAMTAHEVITRVKYAAVCQLERHAHGRGRLQHPDRLRHALIEPLRSAGDWQSRLLASRHERPNGFFAGAVDKRGMRALFETRYRSEREAALGAAERVMRGQVDFFGQTFRVDSDVAWNRDPVSGVEWPRRYHRDVPIHGGDRGWGDVKYVWELNRHQFLIDLARASFLTGDPRLAHRIRELIRGWIADNPYATGVNWSCALEPAFRIFSWLWAYYLCLDEQREHPEYHLELLTSIHDHGRFLHTHLELYSSPYNHLIGESSALYLLGVLFPEFADAPAWRTRAKRVLESRLSGQFYADGGTVEQSTFYHHATLGFYLLAAVLGRRHGDQFSSNVWDAIERAISFSMALVQPDGRTPSIGGADDGKPLRMEHLPLWDFRPFQAIGSVLFKRGDFKSIAGRFFEDALWLLGAEGLRQFDELPEKPPPFTSVALPASGYSVLRSDWSAAADYVCVDCGEQAGEIRTDAVPNSVHGHADCLSVIVALGGRPILVDSGLYCYNGDPAWEAHFRRTAAHSTARIDEADQALHLGKMAWSHSYRASREYWSTAEPLAAFVGSHDGYRQRGGDTVHRRLVWLRPGGYVVVYDEFESRGDHRLDLTFQFARGNLEIVAPGLASFDEDVRIAWTAAVTLSPGVQCGGAAPDQGWIAPSLGVRQPAPRLTLTGRIGPRAAVLTVIARGLALEAADPGSAGDAPLHGLVRITGPGVEDVVSAPAIALGREPAVSDRRVVITSVDRGREVAAAHVSVAPPDRREAPVWSR